VLAEATERMRARGKAEFAAADIFMDFSAIQVTIGVMAQALIEGRIDCRTAGRLAVGLQTASKLLWMIHCKRREESKGKRIQPADVRRWARITKPKRSHCEGGPGAERGGRIEGGTSCRPGCGWRHGHGRQYGKECGGGWHQNHCG